MMKLLTTIVVGGVTLIAYKLANFNLKSNSDKYLEIENLALKAQVLKLEEVNQNLVDHIHQTNEKINEMMIDPWSFFMIKSFSLITILALTASFIWWKWSSRNLIKREDIRANLQPSKEVIELKRKIEKAAQDLNDKLEEYVATHRSQKDVFIRFVGKVRIAYLGERRVELLEKFIDNTKILIEEVQKSLQEVQTENRIKLHNEFSNELKELQKQIMHTNESKFERLIGTLTEVNAGTIRGLLKGVGAVVQANNFELWTLLSLTDLSTFEIFPRDEGKFLIQNPNLWVKSNVVEEERYVERIKGIDDITNTLINAKKVASLSDFNSLSKLDAFK